MPTRPSSARSRSTRPSSRPTPPTASTCSRARTTRAPSASSSPARVPTATRTTRSCGWASSTPNQNNLPKATDQFKRLTEIAPNDPRAHLLLAATYNAGKQYDKARSEFKASYGLQHSPDALLGLGQTDIATKNYAECAQVYDALDRGAPDLSRQNPSILYGLGQCYQKSNQPAKAKTAYQKLLSYVKPGSQAANQVKALIDQIDRSGKPAAQRKTAKKG